MSENYPKGEAHSALGSDSQIPPHHPHPLRSVLFLGHGQIYFKRKGSCCSGGHISCYDLSIIPALSCRVQMGNIPLTPHEAELMLSGWFCYACITADHADVTVAL